MSVRYYLWKRVDGKASLTTATVPPEEVFSKWHPNLRAEYTGEYQELEAGERPRVSDRHKWLAITEVKSVE